MADVGFCRSDRAESAFGGSSSKCLGQCFDFRRVAQLRAGPVRFDVSDRLGIDARRAKRFNDHFGLADNARRRVADLQRSVVVDGGAADDRVNRIAIRERVLQPLEHDDADAVAEDGAGGVGTEYAALAVGRDDSAFLIQVSALLRRVNRDASGQCDVGLVVQQALTGVVHRDERRRAERLHREAWPFEIEFVSRQGRSGPRGVVDGGLDLAECLHDGAIPIQLMRQVRAERSAGDKTDRALESLRVVACLLERLPHALEKEALLRIQDLRLARREPEEGRVEQISTVDDPSGIDVVRILGKLGILAGGEHLLSGERADRLDALAQVAPERGDVVRSRKTADHRANRDLGAVELVVAGCLHVLSQPT